jgi:hypothetical protein
VLNAPDGYYWVPASYPVLTSYPVVKFYQSNVPVPRGYYLTVGSPFNDAHNCLLPWGCSSAFSGIKSDQDYAFTIVVRITWSNFYPPYQVLAIADYIPAPPIPGGLNFIQGDIACVPFTTGSLDRCRTNYWYTTGLPTDQPYVGYLKFPACRADPTRLCP